MAKKRKGPTPRRKNPCLHCQRAERLPGGVWCQSCTDAGRRREKANQRRYMANWEPLPKPLTGLHWWEWSIYRESDKDAYLREVEKELEDGG